MFVSGPPASQCVERRLRRMRQHVVTHLGNKRLTSSREAQHNGPALAAHRTRIEDAGAHERDLRGLAAANRKRQQRADACSSQTTHTAREAASFADSDSRKAPFASPEAAFRAGRGSSPKLGALWTRLNGLCGSWSRGIGPLSSPTLGSAFGSEAMLEGGSTSAVDVLADLRRRTRLFRFVCTSGARAGSRVTCLFFGRGARPCSRTSLIGTPSCCM